MTDVRTGWDALKSLGAPTRGEFKVYSTSTSDPESSPLLAVDSQGYRHLLVPISATTAVNADTKSAGVQILGKRLIDGDVEAHFIDIVCSFPHLNALFDHVVEEVLEGIEGSDASAGAVAQRVLNRWRELLERNRPNILSVEKLAGLFAELRVLERIAATRPDSVAYWTGPASARFDFQGGNSAIEVKASSAADPTSIEIHGVDQLDPPAEVTLSLVVVLLEQVNATGESVADVVQRIRKLGVDAHMLTTKLRAVGYDEVDSEHYRSVRWRVRRELWFDVNHTFPRVIRSSFQQNNLPSGVVRLNYAIDLTSTPVSAVPSAEILSKFAMQQA